MKKGRVFSIVFIVLLLAIIVFWYLGKKEEAKKMEEREIQLAQYDEIIEQNNNLESLVAKSYNASESNSIETKYLYSIKNLNTEQDSTLDDVKVYALNIKKILLPYTKNRPNEANLVLEALKNNDFTKLKPLGASLNTHKTALSQLLQTKVPRTAQIVHLRLINNIQNQIILLTAMKDLNADPEKALIATREYPVVASSFFQATNNINVYLENRGFTFAESEQIKLFYNL